MVQQLKHSKWRNWVLDLPQKDSNPQLIHPRGAFQLPYRTRCFPSTVTRGGPSGNQDSKNHVRRTISKEKPSYELGTQL